MTSEIGARLSIKDGLARITLCQPAKRNAFNDEVIATLRAYLATTANNPSVRALVLDAEGKHFCAGADLAWMKRMVELSYEENVQDANNLASLLKELNSLPIPTIALTQGAAYGGAVGLIACCDIAVASDNASFCLSEVKLGLSPATISPYVIGAMGARRCRKLFLTAEVFDASKAKEFGLIHDVVTLNELENEGLKVVNQLLNNGPNALSATKSLISEVTNSSDPERLFNYTSELIAKLRVSEEGQEGLNAFFEKRKPAYAQD